MNRFKSFWAILTALIMLFAVAMPLMAADDTGFADVDGGAWYAGAVRQTAEAGLMKGVEENRFAPDEAMTRSMLASVLYRMAGSPEVSGDNPFSDVIPGSWCDTAITWAAQQKLVNGYGDAAFGVNDAVTREQLVAILWRYEGSPAATAAAFADQAEIEAYAAGAVNWAKAENIISGLDGNRFAPRAVASRAQVAAILVSYQQLDKDKPMDNGSTVVTPPVSGASSSGGSHSGGSHSGGGSSSGGHTPTPTPEPTGSSRVLVAYFSGSGNTRGVAEKLVSALGDGVAELYEITPQQPYTAADLDYTRADCRSVTEQHDPAARPAISGSVADMDRYDIVFLGYPIWNNDAPRIIYTFLESEELAGKTIVPFCTSGGSGIANSVSLIRGLAADATWLDGRRCLSSDSAAVLAAWANGLGLDFAPETAQPEPEPAPTPEPEPEPTPEPEPGSKALVAYFSATNNTEGIAQHIAGALGEDMAELYEIVPETPYTAADLNYNTDCRANREQNDAAARPAISGSVTDMSDYDVVFLGYPIWWGQAPKIIYTFLESYDFSGKTIVPFCTSGSSGIGSSAANLHSLAGGADWLDGRRFSGGASQATVESWLFGLSLDITTK